MSGKTAEEWELENVSPRAKTSILLGRVVLRWWTTLCNQLCVCWSWPLNESCMCVAICPNTGKRNSLPFASDPLSRTGFFHEIWENPYELMTFMSYFVKFHCCKFRGPEEELVHRSWMWRMLVMWFLRLAKQATKASVKCLLYQLKNS